ncbi:MAG: class I SAM-dependent methyltransferase [Candidatus Hodarchaeota archaeon]
MAYYDRISKQWHRATGSQGGALKKYVLNELIISRIKRIEAMSILELGAGNGYFIPLMLKRFSGQNPSRVVITDQSSALLEIAKRNFRVLQAGYLILDIYNEFPFRDGEFDLILSTMVFNEVSDSGFQQALKECNRVLNKEGVLLATVLHPDFIDNLSKRGQIKQHQNRLTMPSTKGMRVPVVKRSLKRYYYLLNQSGFQFKTKDVYPTKKVLNAKPGLQKAGKIPLATLFSCKKDKV